MNLPLEICIIAPAIVLLTCTVFATSGFGSTLIAVPLLARAQGDGSGVPAPSLQSPDLDLGQAQVAALERRRIEFVVELGRALFEQCPAVLEERPFVRR